jgi:SAM-dependent methyltransferase
MHVLAKNNEGLKIDMNLGYLLKALPASVNTLLKRANHRLRGYNLEKSSVNRVNLGCGAQKIPGYLGIDIGIDAELCLDLAIYNLPFKDHSLESVVCISAINYFSYSRAGELIRDVYRVLRPGGIARFAVQDMESIARRYVEKDVEFFFQKLPDGKDRFKGPTLGDKFAAWFYGYAIKGTPCQYFYDFDSLKFLFNQAGFSVIERMAFLESRLDQIEMIDNRPDQMFFLEAVK